MKKTSGYVGLSLLTNILFVFCRLPLLAVVPLVDWRETVNCVYEWRVFREWLIARVQATHTVSWADIFSSLLWETVCQMENTVIYNAFPWLLKKTKEERKAGHSNTLRISSFRVPLGVCNGFRIAVHGISYIVLGSMYLTNHRFVGQPHVLVYQTWCPTNTLFSTFLWTRAFPAFVAATHRGWAKSVSSLYAFIALGRNTSPLLRYLNPYWKRTDAFEAINKITSILYAMLYS